MRLLNCGRLRASSDTAALCLWTANAFAPHGRSTETSGRFYLILLCPCGRGDLQRVTSAPQRSPQRVPIAPISVG